ncbi:hypothetical protein NBRC116188_21180 [Oceaniserpentilla sp. 4NH20-0058]
MSIDKHIHKYGPQNKYKKGFELTNKPEQVRLFSAINHSIHNQGQGLNKITFHNPQGQPINRLLRNPEVIHLKDVANLIDTFYMVSYICLFSFLALLAYLKASNIQLPSIKQQAIGILSFSALCLIAVMVIGPITVFYALHEWVFPQNHQWFFYYQESLMTVLMKAPYLFGAIAGLIAILAIGIYLVINWLVQTYLIKSAK